MSIKELVTELGSLFPTYYMFPIVDDNNPPPTFPFIAYVPSSEYQYADNENYLKIETFRLEYYFKIKDLDNENLLEEKLKQLGFTFSRSEDNRIDDMFVIYYDLS